MLALRNIWFKTLFQIKAKGSARIGTNPSVVEARAVTGVSYIIETFSERPKYFRQQVQSVMKTHG